MVQFYNRMRDIRKDNDKTQQQVADHLNIQRNQYQLYESGKRYIPVDLLAKFCEYFEVSSDYILGLKKGLDWPREEVRAKQSINSTKYSLLFSFMGVPTFEASLVETRYRRSTGGLTEKRYRDKGAPPNERETRPSWGVLHRFTDYAVA